MGSFTKIPPVSLEGFPHHDYRIVRLGKDQSYGPFVYVEHDIDPSIADDNTSPKDEKVAPTEEDKTAPKVNISIEEDVQLPQQNSSNKPLKGRHVRLEIYGKKYEVKFHCTKTMVSVNLENDPRKKDATDKKKETDAASNNNIKKNEKAVGEMNDKSENMCS